MSLASAQEFTATLPSNPALLKKVSDASNGKSTDEAATAVVAIAKGEGFDFTPAEALEVRKGYVRELSDHELDSVAGGGSDPLLDMQLQMAGTWMGGRIAPGGGIIGGGVGAGVSTAVSGGSASESVASGAMAANDSLNESKSVVQEIFSGW